MNYPQKHWIIYPPLPEDVASELGEYPPILRQILFNRGYASREAAEHFLTARTPAPDSDPFRMLGMEAAVMRIQVAIQERHPIAVYGDYDADGVTATALLVEALSKAGAQAREYIPDRFEEGYGLHQHALDLLNEDGVRLVITVDCGIRSLREARHAQALGLDLIVIDHHHPGEELPPAAAIINPHQDGDAYPEKDLAGVGLAYKLVCALDSRGLLPGFDPRSQLDLVALGTVADLTPLTGENRSLVRTGIQQLKRTQRPGLQSLMGVARLHPARVSAPGIGFILGPRLNAAGRLASALAAYRLLITQDRTQAAKLALELDDRNRERQRLTREIQAHAEELALQGDPQAMLLFAAHPSFNPGVVGLAAARLQERYHRPAIVAHAGPDSTRGSCRSIPDFHITDALDRCADLLVKYGGHAAAAGFTVKNSNLEELKQRLEAITREALHGRDLAPELEADMEIPLEVLQAELLGELALLQPTGMANPEPLFVTRSLGVRRARAVGREGAHLKLTVTDGRLNMDAIAFRQGAWAGNMPKRVDLLYSFELNEYNGRTSLQLNVKDLKPSD